MRYIGMCLVFVGFMLRGFVSVSAGDTTGTNIKSTIEEIINAKSPLERSTAVKKLYEQKPRSAEDVQALLGALRENVIDFNTTEILWKNDNPELIPFIPLFIQALNDSDMDVQGAAALTLGKMKAREAVPSLVKRFESIPLIDERSPIEERKKAETYGRLGMFLAASLGMIGDPAAVPALIARREFYYLEFGETPLAWIGAPALPALLAVARDKKDPRREHVCFIIGKIKDPAAIPSLQEVLKDPDAAPDLKNSARTALKRMSVPSENFD